jgi:hypothetical protein
MYMIERTSSAKQFSVFVSDDPADVREQIWAPLSNDPKVHGPSYSKSNGLVN